MSQCCKHSYCQTYTEHESGLCDAHLPTFYGVFYEDGNCEFNFLAAFDTREKADEYAKRQVWKHLKTFVSRQPIY